MVEVETDILYAALLGAIVGGIAASIGAYAAIRNRAHAAERARMATEIMYHVMTAVVLLEEGLVALEEVLHARDDKSKSKKEVRDLAEQRRKQLVNAFAGYDPLRPHIDYRVGKVMRLDAKAMKMLDELERRLLDAFNLWEGGRLLLVAASGKDDEAVEGFDRLVIRSAEDVKRFAAVLKRV
ncbi:MAG: hypothetical protein JSW25_06955 [Thermoplasmata archaeon]|nr:MAG: hypothetical protein JSW25_06955 [Thermoplasmata archaeon]